VVGISGTDFKSFPVILEVGGCDWNRLVHVSCAVQDSIPGTHRVGNFLYCRIICDVGLIYRHFRVLGEICHGFCGLSQPSFVTADEDDMRRSSGCDAHGAFTTDPAALDAVLGVLNIFSGSVASYCACDDDCLSGLTKAGIRVRNCGICVVVPSRREGGKWWVRCHCKFIFPQ
jgi:hypothetical protein